MLYRLSGNSVGVEEVTDDELFQFFSGDFAVFVGVDDLNVRSNISGSWLEWLVHGPVTVHKPLGYLY